MFKDVIPCCYFPTTVAIVDDNVDFASHLSLALGSELNSKRFSSPKKALTYLNQRADEIKNLFTQHIVMAENHPMPTKLSIDVDIAALCQQIYSQKHRFEYPIVLIVDYSMPEMNGLEFCQQLVGLPYKKIMLTGEANYDFAVKAFNQGQIERFIKKEELDLPNQLKNYTTDLNIHYFVDLSKGLFELLNAAGQQLLHSPAFVKLFNSIVKQHDIIEFYLLDESGSFLLLNREGQQIEFLVRAEDDMRSFQELAEDEGVDAVASAVAKREKMPYLITWQDRITPASEWTLHDAHLLRDGDDCYYYSVVFPDASTSRQPLTSYQQFLQAS